MIIGKETRESFKHFEGMFKFFDDCQKEETNPLIDGVKPLKVTTNCDMAATWRGVNLGGGLKTRELACHCCSIRDDDLVRPNICKCARWCQELHTTNQECFIVSFDAFSIHHGKRSSVD
jgi:hypothetical protein